MWWAGSRTLDWYVGTRATLVCEGNTVLLRESMGDRESAVRRGVEFMSQLDGSRLRVRAWLSGGLSRPFILPAVQGVRSEDEVQRIAGALITSRTGLAADSQVWTDGDSKDRTVAVAADRAAIQSVMAIASKKIGLSSVAPWWSAVLRHVLSAEGSTESIAVQDCDSLTVLAGRAVMFELATTYSPIGDREAARSAYSRALLSLDEAFADGPFVRLHVGGDIQTNVAGLALGACAEISR